MDLDRVERLQEHVTRAGYVCPWAASANFGVIVETPALRLAQIGAYRRAIADWITRSKGARAVVLVAVSPDDPPWAQARDWAHDNFLSMLTVSFSLRGVPLEEAFTAAEEMRDGLVNPDNLMRPLLVLPVDDRDVVTNTVGIGPQYKPTHPRYAPVTAIISTWGRDIEHAQRSAPEAVARVKRARGQAYGGEYDADELWLPLEYQGKGGV